MAKAAEKLKNVPPSILTNRNGFSFTAFCRLHYPFVDASLLHVDIATTLDEDTSLSVVPKLIRSILKYEEV